MGWYENRGIGDPEYAADRLEMAIVLYSLEHWEKARVLLQAMQEEEPDNLNTLGYLGMIAAKLGEQEHARLISDRLAAIRRPYLFGRHTYFRACIHALLGEKSEAMKLIRESLAQGIDYTQFHADMKIQPLQDYDEFRDLIRPKG